MLQSNYAIILIKCDISLFYKILSSLGMYMIEQKLFLCE